jgi:hypothetical protein
VSGPNNLHLGREKIREISTCSLNPKAYDGWKIRWDMASRVMVEKPIRACIGWSHARHTQAFGVLIGQFAYDCDA